MARIPRSVSWQRCVGRWRRDSRWPARRRLRLRRAANGKRRTISAVHVTAIIAAGGRGARLGAGVPKQLLQVGGRPILQHAVDAFAHHPAIADVVVALPEDLAVAPPEFLNGYIKPIEVV